MAVGTLSGEPMSGEGREITEHPAFWPTLCAVPMLLMAAALTWSIVPLLWLAFYLAVMGWTQHGRSARRRASNRRTTRVRE